MFPRLLVIPSQKFFLPRNSVTIQISYISRLKLNSSSSNIYIFFFAFFEEIVISRERLFGAIGLTNRAQKRSRKLVPVHDNLARFFALVPRLPFSPVSPCIPVTYRNHGRIPGPLFVPVYRCTRAAATRPATAGQVIRTHGPCSSTFLSCPVSGGPGEAASYVESYNFSFDRIFLLHIHP